MTKLETPPVHCKYGCGKVFKNQYHATLHYKSSKKTDLEFVCPYSTSTEKKGKIVFVKCKCSFSCPMKLQKHTSNVHKRNRFYTCDGCHKKFSTSNDLWHHQHTPGRCKKVVIKKVAQV